VTYRCSRREKCVSWSTRLGAWQRPRQRPRQRQRQRQHCGRRPRRCGEENWRGPGERHEAYLSPSPTSRSSHSNTSTSQPSCSSPCLPVLVNRIASAHKTANRENSVICVNQWDPALDYNERTSCAMLDVFLSFAGEYFFWDSLLIRCPSVTLRWRLPHRRFERWRFPLIVFHLLLPSQAATEA